MQVIITILIMLPITTMFLGLWIIERWAHAATKDLLGRSNKRNDTWATVCDDLLATCKKYEGVVAHYQGKKP